MTFARGKYTTPLATTFATPDALTKNIPGFLERIADYTAADGIGVYHAGEAHLTGVTPTREEFLQLIRFLNTASGQVFSTHHLADLFPEASDYPMRAAGVLSIPISRITSCSFARK
jgi:light-regulated signal transduction histidine kinase (bacteriophytochrome)